MSDFIVQEEDGTSHLTLEEGGGSLTREEAGGISGAASFDVVLAVSASSPGVTQPTFSTWEAGYLTVPSSTGTQTVTGLRDSPVAVFFFGANWLTEDTAVTTTGTGLFRGMAAPKWDAPGTILQNSAFVSPAGDQHSEQNHAILANTTAGNNTDLYAADVTSIDATGFTLNWLVGASGGYKVVWLALYNVANVGSYIGGTTTLALGWKAGASLLHGAWAGPAIAGADRTQEFYGGAAYPGTAGGASWPGAGLTAFTFPTSTSAQYNIGIYNQAAGTVICQGGSFIGPFLTAQNVTAVPSGSGLTNLSLQFRDATNQGMIVAWDDEDTITGRITPGAAQGNTATVSGLSFEPGLVIGYSISDEPQGQSTGGRGAVGFSVITNDFQWTALVDGVSSRGSFQSFQRGVCDRVSGTSVHAGTVALTGSGFVITTEEDDIGASSWVWHAFGHPFQPVSWIPQIWRLNPP